MSVLDEAKAELELLERGISPSSETVKILAALVVEHETLTTEMHQRELHHFETEKLLTEAGIDPDEWDYHEFAAGGFTAPGAQSVMVTMRRRPARSPGPWEVVEDAQ